jgi:LPXTG-site transpeptidase (sortase) family protein
MGRSRLSRAEWLGLIAAGLLMLVGAGSITVALGWQAMKLQVERDWLASAEARRAARAIAEPTPIWLAEAPTPETTDSPVVAMTDVVPLESAADAADRGIALAPQRRPLDVIDLLAASFVFFDPPQYGAHARLSISLRNRGHQPVDVAVSIPTDWLDNYRLLTTLPESTIDPEPADGMRRLTFSLQPRSDLTLLFEFVATSDSVEPPVAQVALATGDALGEAHPRTMAPRPRPGPISALRIPSLRINSAVVPTTWDPPAFVIGEVRGSADVGLGNAVLVGHLTGAAGAIFKDLKELKPGDPIIATSRGIEYSFEVSDVQTRPAADSTLTRADAQPRLTLMTCTGTWDPIGRDYSDRLWIIAEPPDQAARTIADNAARPPTPTPPQNDTAALPGVAPDRATIAPALVSAGLGAERSALDRRWGPPLGETPGKLVVYRQGAVEFHVAFTPEPPRARLISVQSLGPGATLNLPKAVERARAEFPADTAPRIPAPEGGPGIVVERMTSAALAGVLGDDSDSNVVSGSNPGDFMVVYQRDASGTVTRVVVAAGDNVAAAIDSAAR